MNKTRTDLLPCPFCDHAAQIIQGTGAFRGRVQAECGSCRIATFWLEEEVAIYVWNRRAHPSLANPLTPYGMLVRALRIVAHTSLHDMGQALLLSPAKLSAMEFGRESVTPEVVREVGTYFESLGIHNMRPALQFAVDVARTGDAS